MGRRYAPEPIIENMEEPEEITSEYSNFGYDTDDAKEKEIDEIINSAKAYKSKLNVRHIKTTTVTRKTARRTKKKRSLPQQIPQRLNPKKLTKTKKITQKHLKNTRT